MNERGRGEGGSLQERGLTLCAQLQAVSHVRCELNTLLIRRDDDGPFKLEPRELLDENPRAAQRFDAHRGRKEALELPRARRRDVDANDAVDARLDEQACDICCAQRCGDVPRDLRRLKTPLLLLRLDPLCD